MFLIILKLFVSIGWSWTGQEVKLYQNRNFVELEYLLFSKREHQLAQLMKLQEADLSGCKAIHDGNGRAPSFVKCVKFLNREYSLKLFSQQRKELVGDLNLLCSKFADKKEFVDKVLKEDKLFTHQEWMKCHSEIWRQIYLTTYANFLADPVGTLALTRRAERNLSPDKEWASKIKKFMANQ